MSMLAVTNLIEQFPETPHTHLFIKYITKNGR